MSHYLTNAERESTLNAAVCLACGEILVSKHTHDYVICGCPNRSAVDGGPDYRKRSGVNLGLVATVYDLDKAKALSEAVRDAPKWRDVRAKT